MSSARLSRLILSNFKSIGNACIEFSGMTFFIGRNGSGKSNLSDAFAFLSEAMDQPLQAVINRRGGPTSVAHKQPSHPDKAEWRVSKEVTLGLAVEFVNLQSAEDHDVTFVSARYAVEIAMSLRHFRVTREQCSLHESTGKHRWFERTSDGIRSNIDFLQGISQDIVSNESLWLQTIGGILAFAPLTNAIRSMAVYAIEPSTLREFQGHDSGQRLLPDGSNAASVLQALARYHPERFDRLIQIMSSVIPDLADVRSVQTGRKQVLRFYQTWVSEEFGRERLNFDAFNMSDGTLRSFGILLAVFQIARPSLMLIEEPETSIHPAATGAILELLRTISTQTQVIITTHSPEVLDFASSDDSIRVVSWNKGITSVEGVSGAAKNALQAHLSSAGELFRMNILDAPSIFGNEDTRHSLFEELY